MPINDRVYIVLRAGMQNTITVEVNADPDLPEAMRTLLLALRNMPTGERMARALRVLYRGAFVVRDVWPCQPVDRAWPIIQVDWGEGEIILSVDTLCACWVFIGEAQVRRATMLSWGTLHEHGTALS